MCSRGVAQLQKITILFCDFGGSSNGVREFLTSDHFKNDVQKDQKLSI